MLTKTKNFADFKIFFLQKWNFDGGKFLKICSSINLSWGQARCHNKFAPDRFSRFDIYWIQTDRQTDKLNLKIDGLKNKQN